MAADISMEMEMILKGTPLPETEARWAEEKMDCLARSIVVDHQGDGQAIKRYLDWIERDNKPIGRIADLRERVRSAYRVYHGKSS